MSSPQSLQLSLCAKPNPFAVPVPTLSGQWLIPWEATYVMTVLTPAMINLPRRQVSFRQIQHYVRDRVKTG